MGPADPHLVLGTAGHIDHGKTELCRALTGVDTDRLPEEKERGITIVLGFAALELPAAPGSGGVRRVSLVDVPGHEGLVRTMVSGATGIDLVLLVVAADEGVMPQTREHVAICELLGLSRGVVALTKTDLVDDDMASLAEEEVRELLAPTALADAPVLRVSSRTGDGVPALRDALGVACDAGAARTARSGPPRLAVDRVFAAKGFGCVVTGTLVGSGLAVGDAVEVLPSGAVARVRGIQNHGESAELGEPGLRCALNLQGVDVAQVSRGEVVTRPGAIAPTRAVDARVVWLDVAPGSEDAAHVEFLAGTAERRARVAPIGADALVPGQSQYARIHLDGDPVPLLPGDRFVLRGFARTEMGGSTVGGGEILDVAPPHRRRSDPALLRDLEALAAHDDVTDVRVRIARAGLAGVALERLRLETGLEVDRLDAALAALAVDGAALGTPDGTWLDGAAVAALEARLRDALDAYHEAEPLRPGMPTGALRGTIPDNVGRAATELALERLAARGELEIEGDLARRASHRVGLSSEDEALVAQLRREAASAGLEPPALREWAERLAVPMDRLRDLLVHLERQGHLTRTRGDLWFDRAAVDALRDAVVAHLKQHGSLETPAYKDLIGTTRRTAVPLMEHFDEERLTMRSGNSRVLRSR